jgi:hypothetical protein
MTPLPPVPSTCTPGRTWIASPDQPVRAQEDAAARTMHSPSPGITLSDEDVWKKRARSRVMHGRFAHRGITVFTQTRVICAVWLRPCPHTLGILSAVKAVTIVFFRAAGRSRAWQLLRIRVMVKPAYIFCLGMGVLTASWRSRRAGCSSADLGRTRHFVQMQRIPTYYHIAVIGYRCSVNPGCMPPWIGLTLSIVGLRVHYESKKGRAAARSAGMIRTIMIKRSAVAGIGLALIGGVRRRSQFIPGSFSRH